MFIIIIIIIIIRIINKYGLLFPLGKVSSRSTALRNFFLLLPPPCVQCFRVCIPSACEVYSCTADGCRIFNVRINLGACRTHEGGSGTNKSAQHKGSLGGTETLTVAPPLQGIELRVFGFDFRLSNHRDIG